MSLKEIGRRLLRFFGLAETEGSLEWNKWYAEQIRKLEAGEEIEPPWVAFPDSSAIFGWNQGYNHEWVINVWHPFWHKLNEREKDAYFERWEPPDEDWRESLTIYWVGNAGNLKESR